MNDAKKLYQLQEIDLDLGAKQESLNKVVVQLGDSSAAKEAETAVEQARQWLREMEKALRSTEADVEDIRAKLKEVDGKLYGGKVTNLKELAGLQEEAEQLKGKLKEKEDRVLEVMGEIDTAQRGLSVQEQGLKGTRAQWREAQERLAGERDSLQGAIARLAEKRRKQAQDIAQASLTLYEGLRGPLQGKVLAKVEQGRCQGCRLSLSITELKLTRGSRLVQCSSCRRILFLD
ncbi:MAG: hypothetical protein HY671_06440 [Chloroflexi bacterium]|nr:hypothetical protein [Chloroflexota bacterium]